LQVLPPSDTSKNQPITQKEKENEIEDQSTILGINITIQHTFN